MKATLLLFLFFVLSICLPSLSAQELTAQENIPSISWQDQSFWPSTESAKGGFVVIDENRYVLVSMVGKSLTTLKLELFDKRNLAEVISREIPLGKKNKRRAFHQISLIGQKLQLFTSRYQPHKRTNTLYRQPILVDNLQAGDVEIMAHSFTNGQTNTFGINLSKDEEKVLIYNVDDYIKSDPVRVTIQVYDNQFQSIWEHKYLLPFKNKNYVVAQNVIDNAGNVYLIGDYAHGKSLKKHQGSIFCLKSDGTAQEKRFGVAKKFINGLEYHIDQQGILVGVGTFTGVNRSGDLFPLIEGIYLLQYNHQKDRIGQRIVYFEANEFQQNNMALGKKGQFDTRLYLKEVFIKKDNSLLLALEQIEPLNQGANVAIRGTEEWRSIVNNSEALSSSLYEIRTREVYSGGQLLKYYKDIVLVNIKDFKVDWVWSIPKKQRLIANHKPTASYTTLQNGNNFYFVYNDTKRNQDNEELKAYNPLKIQEQAIVVKKLDAAGEWTTYFPEVSLKTPFPICTSMSKPLSDKELLLFGDFGEFYRFGSLKL